MRVFITGGSGYIGGAIVRMLRQAGHDVTGLLRSAKKEAELRALEATPLIGSLADPSTYQSAAAEHDAVIHTAFDWASKGVESDATAIESFLAKGPKRPRIIIYTSGCWILGNTGHTPAAEDAPTSQPAPLVAWRTAHEQRVLAANSGSFHTAVLRPGMVYGGKGGLISSIMFASAEKEGAATFVGDGKNRWSLVYREDLARLYVTVMEKQASGIFHGVDGTPLRVAEVARAASEAAGRGGAVRAVPIEGARKQYGAMADALCLDQALSAPRSLQLGWRPLQASFLAAAKTAYAEWRA